MIKGIAHYKNIYSDNKNNSRYGDPANTVPYLYIRHEICVEEISINDLQVQKLIERLLPIRCLIFVGIYET